MLTTLNNNRGQSLVQVLITAAIGVVVLLLIASIQTNQNRENLSLSEKMATNDFQQQLLRSFSDGSVCTKLLTTPLPALTFDSTHAVAGDPNPPTLTLPATITTIPVSTDANAPPLATVNTAVSALASNVRIASTNPFQITGLVGTNDGTTGSYTGFFAFNFDASSMTRAIHPAGVQVVLKTSTSGTTQTITSCASSAPTNCWVQGPGGLTETACGNIGIGTTSPSSQLEVSGNVSAITVSDTSAPGDHLLLQAAGNGAGGGPLLAGHTDAAGNATFNTSSSRILLGNANFHIQTSSGTPVGTPRTWIDRLTIDEATGNVGIATLVPINPLHVNGAARLGIGGQVSLFMAVPGTGGADQAICYNGITGAIDACPSLRKYKADITPLDIGLETVMKLSPVRYRWKQSGVEDIGFIAEDAVAVDDRFGSLSTDRKLAGVKYDHMVALLTKAVQEMQAEIEELKRQNAACTSH